MNVLQNNFHVLHTCKENVGMDRRIVIYAKHIFDNRIFGRKKDNENTKFNKSI